MGREELKEALFCAVERLTNQPLLDSGRKLVLHYFNNCDGSAFERAVYAMNKYYPDSLKEESSWTKGLRRAMDNLKSAADAWDLEDED